MDVDYPVPPRFDKSSIQHAHEPGQANQLDLLVAEQSFSLRRERLPRLMRDDSAACAGCLRVRETWRLGPVADDRDDLRGIGRTGARSEQRSQVRSVTRDQHSYPQPGHRLCAVREDIPGLSVWSVWLWIASSGKLLYDRLAAVEEVRKYRIGGGLQWACPWFLRSPEIRLSGARWVSCYCCSA